MPIILLLLLFFMMDGCIDAVDRVVQPAPLKIIQKPPPPKPYPEPGRRSPALTARTETRREARGRRQGPS